MRCRWSKTKAVREEAPDLAEFYTVASPPLSFLRTVACSPNATRLQLDDAHRTFACVLVGVASVGIILDRFFTPRCLPHCAHSN